MERLPQDVDLFDLTVRVDGAQARATYIGPPDPSGVQQVNAILPDSDRTGLAPVSLEWFGRELCPPAILRVIPAGPQVPHIVAVTDGVNLLSTQRIETGTVKVAMEDVARPDEFSAWIDAEPVEGLDLFCTDPLPRRYEFNFRIPGSIGPGRHMLDMRLGRRRFAPISIEVLKA